MNTTAKKTAAAIFEDQLCALEFLFGIELEGSTPGEQVSSLGKLAKSNSVLHESLANFFNNPISFSSKFSSTGDTFEAIVKTLFAAACRGAIHDYGTLGAPVKQHWMPLAYLSAFGEQVSKSKNNRSVKIKGISFADGLVMDFETRDSHFIHEHVDDEGFYEDGAEFFFHLVENLYAQGRANQHRPIDHVVVALFFFTQSIRNPRYGQRFLHSKLSEIVDAILANIDAVGPNLKTRFLPSTRSLPFTPYVPPFVDRFGGERVYSLPIKPRTLFTITTGNLKEAEWKQVWGRYYKRIVQQAQARGSFIFGVSKFQTRAETEVEVEAAD